MAAVEVVAVVLDLVAMVSVARANPLIMDNLRQQTPVKGVGLVEGLTVPRRDSREDHLVLAVQD
jgi:hypothetical protein